MPHSLFVLRNGARAAAILAALLAAACGNDHAPAAEPANAAGDPCAGAPAGTLSAVDPWVREAVDGRPLSAGYVTLCNRTDEPATLVAAAFEGAPTVELHETRRSPEGVASMAKVESLAIAARGALSLAPGGAHIMLLDLDRPIAAGERRPLALTFANGEQLVVDAEARGLGAASSAEQHKPDAHDH